MRTAFMRVCTKRRTMKWQQQLDSAGGEMCERKNKIK